MKNNLTPEEEKPILEVQDEWINRFNSLPRIDKEKLEKGINWLYELCGFNKPTIYIVPDPLSAQVLKDVLKKNTVWNTVGNTVRNTVWNTVWNTVENTVENTVGDTVYNTVRNTVWDTVWDTVFITVFFFNTSFNTCADSGSGTIYIVGVFKPHKLYSHSIPFFNFSLSIQGKELNLLIHSSCTFNISFSSSGVRLFFIADLNF